MLSTAAVGVIHEDKTEKVGRPAHRTSDKRVLFQTSWPSWRTNILGLKRYAKPPCKIEIIPEVDAAVILDFKLHRGKKIYFAWNTEHRSVKDGYGQMSTIHCAHTESVCIFKNIRAKQADVDSEDGGSCRATKAPYGRVQEDSCGRLSYPLRHLALLPSDRWDLRRFLSERNSVSDNGLGQDR
ncbi:hypothetical protein ARMSODRAFT_1039989 [Armillaria solidipes]|uniref:Uncharacterized protein n=1 Tax=Armillaria solidipes TaxID=1076256 RepID=A0A2H3BV33_9AGAR|nr:hypothetical protein ARMSODRAFT_1039989 [Armillaria solidipes]